MEEYDYFDDNFDSGFGFQSGVTLDKSKEQSPFLEGLARVRNELTRLGYRAQDFTNAGPKIEADARNSARSVFTSYNTSAGNKGCPTIDMPRDEFVQKVVDEILGMGELTPLLADQSIEDIAVNGPDEIMTYSAGCWERQPMKFESSERLLEMINRGISKSGKKANPVTPIVDAILPGGERVSVVTYPVTDSWPTISIRAHRSKDIQLTDFTRKYEAKNNDAARFDLAKYLPDYTLTDTGGMLTAKAAAYLHAAVLAGLNIVLVGPTGCGKTTMLTALGKCIPPGKRILIIEDTPEIDLNPSAETPGNVIYLRTRAASLDGNVAPVEQADLVKLALRQRPDALTLGEARGKEVFDLLNALNTGHRNGLTSLHAEGPYEVFGRIYMMLSQSEQGRHLDRYRAASLAAGTLNILVTLQIHGSRRSVHSIVEYSGKLIHEETTPEPEIVPVFLNQGGSRGDLGPMLRESCFAQKFADAGMPAYTYTTQPLPGQAAGKGNPDE